VTGVLGLGLLALNNSKDYAALALPALLVVSIPLTFADYAIVLEDRRLPSALLRSMRIWRQRPGQALLTFVTFVLASTIVFTMFIDKIEQSDGVFPGFFGALLLVHAMVAYASDCLLIALLLETPDPTPTGPGSANPE
jgi:hypothetical protein